MLIYVLFHSPGVYGEQPIEKVLLVPQMFMMLAKTDSILVCCAIHHTLAVQGMYDNVQMEQPLYTQYGPPGRNILEKVGI